MSRQGMGARTGALLTQLQTRGSAVWLYCWSWDISAVAVSAEPLAPRHLSIPGQHLSPELSLLLPRMQYSCMSRITSSLAVLQLARNIGNAGFNGVMEASLSSFSLKPVAHSDM